MTDTEKDRLQKLVDYLTNIIGSFSGPIEDSQLSLLNEDDRMEAVHELLRASQSLIEVRRLIESHMHNNR